MLLAVVGPTATGKSAFTLELARRCNGEIVNADAFSLYRGMDIGTAKPSATDRALVPHHQIDVLDLHQPASVAAYQAAVRTDLDAIRSRGHLPILVGGSGLYVRAVLDDLEFPGTDHRIRAGLHAEAESSGPAVMHARLAALDPLAADRIPPGNLRRIVRALEVIELTGRPFSAALPGLEHRSDQVHLGLDLPNDVLDRRVKARVSRMVESGFAAEVETLLGQGLAQAPTASRAIGYPQFAAFVRGECGLDDAIAETQLQTRRLVRRQRKWFRRDPRIRWLQGPSAAAGAPSALLEEALATLARHGFPG